MSARPGSWENIVELARRVDGRANARRSIDEQLALGLARAVLAFQKTIDSWKDVDRTSSK
jgi:hypothetical protein